MLYVLLSSPQLDSENFWGKVIFDLGGSNVDYTIHPSPKTVNLDEILKGIVENE